MTLRSWSKSPSLPREDVRSISSSLGNASPARQSVQSAGMSDRLPFGRMTSMSSTPRRLMLLITASVWPSKAWRRRITVTSAGTSRRWVVCRLFLRITIPHSDLLSSVALWYVLRLIKMWLKAPIEERDTDGTRRMSGGKATRCGTPQAVSRARCSPTST